MARLHAFGIGRRRRVARARPRPPTADRAGELFGARSCHVRVLSALRGSVTTAFGIGDFPQKNHRMARKPSKPSRTSSRNTRSTSDDTTPQLRLGQSSRTVTSRALPPRQSDDAGTRREVPEIRLSGVWLERVGFPKGTRYLISIDKAFREIILQAMEAAPKVRRRRRGS